VNNAESWPEPTWPLQPGSNEPGTKDALRKDRIEPWKALQEKGVGIHIGEWGVFNHTPHNVALAWMPDCLDNWKEAGWGWSLWNQLRHSR
jgi:endoglucanase